MSNTYEAFRSKIKSGDLVAISHAGWTSLHDIQCQIVRMSTESEFCHVGLIWKMNGRLFVIESVIPYVRIIPLSDYAKQGFYVISMNKTLSSKELEFALSTVGKGKYSKWEAIKGFFKALKIGANNFWQCSEFVIACRKLSGVDLGDVATPAKVVQAALDMGCQLNYVRE